MRAGFNAGTAAAAFFKKFLFITGPGRSNQFWKPGGKVAQFFTQGRIYAFEKVEKIAFDKALSIHDYDFRVLSTGAVQGSAK